jgi:hypothetical protein
MMNLDDCEPRKLYSIDASGKEHRETVVDSLGRSCAILPPIPRGSQEGITENSVDVPQVQLVIHFGFQAIKIYLSSEIGLTKQGYWRISEVDLGSGERGWRVNISDPTPRAATPWCIKTFLDFSITTRKQSEEESKTRLSGDRYQPFPKIKEAKKRVNFASEEMSPFYPFDVVKNSVNLRFVKFMRVERMELL